MPSIRDLIAAIRHREGVDAVIVSGRDGLVIDSQVRPGLDVDDLAARVPPIVGAADDLGVASDGGELVTAVLEHRGRLAILSVLSADTCLLVLVTPRADIGQLLFELRRNRERIAALV
jgi:predicted regulator of Ras-like GTPase activity (Roadblock/LC7/MglB family)